MNKVLTYIGAVALTVLLVFASYASGLFDHFLTREYDNAVNEIWETGYENRKKVEDTARAMISSYEADKLMYEQYANSDSELERSWASSAKSRANTTASKYNNYILENEFVWKDNLPSDIKYELSYLE